MPIAPRWGIMQWATQQLFAAASGAALVISGIALAPASPAEVSPMGACDSGWYYSVQSRGTDTFSPVGGILTGYNGTSRYADVTFTSTTSGAVSLTSTGTVGVSVSTALVSINATYSIAAARSKAVTRGVNMRIDVPPKRYGNGQYGAFRANIRGKSQYRTPSCSVALTRYNTIKAPWRAGWKTWISS